MKAPSHIKREYLAALDAVVTSLAELTGHATPLYLLALEGVAAAEGQPRRRVSAARAAAVASRLEDSLSRLVVHFRLASGLDLEHEGILGLDSSFEVFLAREFQHSGAVAAQSLRAGAALAWKAYKATNSRDVLVPEGRQRSTVPDAPMHRSASGAASAASDALAKSKAPSEISETRPPSLSGGRDSNPRPRAWEARALPTELPPLTSGALFPRTERPSQGRRAVSALTSGASSTSRTRRSSDAGISGF